MNGCVVKAEERSDKNLTEEGKQAMALLDDPKVRAFLIVVRNAEAYGRVRNGGQILQYDEAFGFKKIPNFNDHPGTLPGSSSSAAGAYQIMKATWFGKGTDKGAKKILGLSDFSPLSQDIFAAYKLKQKGVVKKLLADDFAGAVQAASLEWASFPDKDKGDPETNPRSRYSGQAEDTPSLSWLRDKYNKALGK
jgi:muramidase (phage lysozyme)